MNLTEVNEILSLHMFKSIGKERQMKARFLLGLALLYVIANIYDEVVS